jgi:2,5-dioxopentanoate dehydrogenase
MTITGQHFIAGRRSGQGAPLYSKDAQTGEEFSVSFFEATANEISHAAKVAHQAFSAFRKTSPEQRATLLHAIADEIDALGQDFFDQVKRETALPQVRLEGERKRTSGQMRLFAATLRRGDFLGTRIDQAQPQHAPLPRPDLRQYRIAIGPVAVFGASNFPVAFSVAGGDTASALAAGCPVVVKAHPGHMVTSEYTASAIERAVSRTGMPAGVFSMLYGAATTGAQLVQQREIKAVAFTGSHGAGRALFDLAQGRPEPIPVFAEMSSVNPLFILPSALATRGKEIASELAASITLGCGQFCTKPGLIFGVRSEEFTAFSGQLQAAIEAATPQPMLSDGISRNFRSGLAKLRSLPGVHSLTFRDTEAKSGGYLQSIAGDQFLQDHGAAEEVFGPSALLVELNSADDFQRIVEHLPGQLTATVLATPDDLENQSGLITTLEEKAGRLLFNGYPTGVEVCDTMVHGGPYPATSDSRSTSVGTLAIDRFLRPVCYQNYPDANLPPALQNANPLKINRLIDGQWTRDALTPVEVQNNA